jgi:hypothetical protein
VAPEAREERSRDADVAGVHADQRQRGVVAETLAGGGPRRRRRRSPGGSGQGSELGEEERAGNPLLDQGVERQRKVAQEVEGGYRRRRAGGPREGEGRPVWTARTARRLAWTARPPWIQRTPRMRRRPPGMRSAREPSRAGALPRGAAGDVRFIVGIGHWARGDAGSGAVRPDESPGKDVDRLQVPRDPPTLNIALHAARCPARPRGPRSAPPARR